MNEIKAQLLKGFAVGHERDKDFIAAESEKQALEIHQAIHGFDEDESFFENVEVERMTDEQLDNPFTMEGEQFTYRMILESCVEADILGNNYES